MIYILKYYKSYNPLLIRGFIKNPSTFYPPETPYKDV